MIHRKMMSITQRVYFFLFISIWMKSARMVTVICINGFPVQGNRAAVISDKFMSIFDEKDMKGDLRKRLYSEELPKWK